MSRTILKRKEKALKIFLDKLFNDGVKDSIAKIILFGSFAEGRAKSDSDIDVLILATDSKSKILDACADAQLEASIATGESIEPIIRCIDEARYIDSLFMYQVLRDGKELYTMGDKEIRKKESRNYLELAEEFLAAAEKVINLGLYRISVDIGYNACELAVKGLLLKKVEKLPSRHSGIVNKFSDLFARTGVVPKELGRRLNRALTKRNDARYEPHAEITKAGAIEIITLAKELIAILEKEI
ncbi:MAG: HEPN domain-containing protein [candidate division WOR-3 bacterium]